MNLRTAIELTLGEEHEPSIDDVQQALLELGRALRSLEESYDYVSDGARGFFLLAHSPLTEPKVLELALKRVNDTVAHLCEAFRDEHSASDRAERLVFECAREYARNLHPDTLRALRTSVDAWEQVYEGHGSKYDAEVDIAKRAADAAQLALYTFIDRVRDKFPEEMR
jgi:hypothetical protein